MISRRCVTGQHCLSQAYGPRVPYIDLVKPCPTCGAESGKRCKAASGKTTDTHQARLYGVKVSKSNELRPRRTS